MVDFANFIFAHGFLEIDLKGSRFTWSNKCHGKNHIQVKLDRVLILSNWDILSKLHLSTLPRSTSNHSSLILRLEEQKPNGPFPFRHEIMQNPHPNFKDLLQHWWNLPYQGTSMFHIAQKLKRIIYNMQGWNRISFRNIFHTQFSILSNIKDIQAKMETRVDDDDTSRREREPKEKQFQVTKEEIFGNRNPIYNGCKKGTGTLSSSTK